MVGLYNKRTGTVQLVEAPMHIMPCEVKALAARGTSGSMRTSTWRESQKALGQLFGTAKAVKAIRDRERGQIDVKVIQGVADHLQDSIMDATVALPSQGMQQFFPHNVEGN